MKSETFGSELQDYWFKVVITLPWAFFFLGMGFIFGGSPCSEDLTSKINYAYNYHLYSSIFIFFLIGERLYRKSRGRNASKIDYFAKGIKVLEIIQSLNAWIALIGILWSYSTDCSSQIKNWLLIYILFQIGLILSPFLKLAYRLWRIKNAQSQSHKNKVNGKEQKKKK